MYIKWCVIKISTKYVSHPDTLFSVTNAANSHNKRNIKVTGDFPKFKMMFDDNITIITSTSSRVLKRGALKPMYPTDEQAETLVKGEIPIIDFLSVCFKDQTDLAEAKAALYQYDTSNFVVDPVIFEKERK